MNIEQVAAACKVGHTYRITRNDVTFGKVMTVRVSKVEQPHELAPDGWITGTGEDGSHRVIAMTNIVDVTEIE